MLPWMTKTVVSGGQRGANVIVFTVLTFSQKYKCELSKEFQ
jgi:hypothetical protein